MSKAAHPVSGCVPALLLLAMTSGCGGGGGGAAANNPPVADPQALTTTEDTALAITLTEGMSGKMAFARSDGSTFPPTNGIVLYDFSRKTASFLRTKDNAMIWESTVSLSPDGSKIAYAGYQVEYGGYQIFTMDTDGSNIRNLTNNDDHNFFPIWSPDGKKLMFLGGNRGRPQLCSMNADGTGRTQITDVSVVVGGISVSSTGEKVALATGPQRGGRPTLEQGIYLMDIDGSSLTPVATSDRNVSYYSPAWSPDGDRIAFVSRHGPNESPREQPYFFEIMTVNIDGSNKAVVIHLTFENYITDTYVSWSPQGDKLAFNYGGGARDTRVHVYLVNPDGSGLTQLTTGKLSGGCPSWIE